MRLVDCCDGHAANTGTCGQISLLGPQDHVRMTVFASLSDFHTNKSQNDSVVKGCVLRLQFMLLGSDSLQMSFRGFTCQNFLQSLLEGVKNRG